MTKQARYVFCAGNGVIGALILLLDLSLTLRQWALDVPVITAALLLLTTTAKALLQPANALRWLRIGAWTLLTLGVTFTSASVLSLAFLSGVHGQLLRHGIETLLLLLATSVPYVLVYPLVLLAWTAHRDATV